MGRVYLKKNHPFYSTSKEFLQKENVEKKKQHPICLEAKCWNPFWLKSRLRMSNGTPILFSWRAVCSKNQHPFMMGKCTLPPKKEVLVDFSIFFPRRFSKRSSRWDTFLGVALTEPLGPSKADFFPPWKSRKHFFSPHPCLCTSRMILFWSCWHGRCGSC